MTFIAAVKATPHLAYREGLQALRAQDRPHINAEDPRQLRGSVDVDSALQATDPQGNRWDFGIAYKHSNRQQEVIYWVEMHTASDSEVGRVIKKARWLLTWLKGKGAPLAPFERDIVWVSSGATSFTLSSPQRKQMAAAGLRHCGRVLQIPNKRPN